jgi:hypothetical protein
MSADPSTTLGARPSLRHRADTPAGLGDLRGLLGPAVFLAAAAGFVLVGGGNLDLGPTEAKVGISAVEQIGPFGQTLGGWEPGVWVGSVLPSKIWAVLGRMNDAAIVRWPTAIAGILIGFVLCRGMRRALGPKASALTALCLFGGLALIDRSADAGLDLIAGLGTIAALNRMLTKGSDWLAGLFASWAFLAGGWPTLALIALASILLGRAGATLSFKMILPVLATIVGWSAWALASTKAQVWAAALSLPLTQGSDWTMALGMIGLGLPWSPFALLGFSPRVRDAWAPGGRAYVVGWGQIALASLVVGTVVPGLAGAARMSALAGLAVVAAASWEAVLSSDRSTAARRWLHVASLAIVVGWTVGVGIWGTYLALAVGYYRGLAMALISLAIVALFVGIASAWRGERRGTLAALVLVAISLKLAHWGHHVPEWNYRHSQAPWGRAIGQWLPPGATVNVLVGWPPDLIFAIGHPVRQLADPRLLPERPGPSPKFILLTGSEHANWQPSWPKIVPVAELQDEFGDGRVLARTEGPFSWRKAALEARAAE